ncbi:MAG TPA: response regulator [Polyangiaceae bacterium]|nr:response regulator [Polyangiaceae bacterium]
MSRDSQLEAAQLGGSHTRAEAEARRPVSVMIVEDDADIRETISEVLEDEGYAVVSASNGAEALELLRSTAPQVILMDLSMPVMSGQQFRSHQLADPTLAGIPTVVMTAAANVGEKMAGMQVSEVLAKPIRMEGLLDSISRYCRRKH